MVFIVSKAESSYLVGSKVVVTVPRTIEIAGTKKPANMAPIVPRIRRALSPLPMYVKNFLNGTSCC
jgi:hypothetical protein